MMTTLRPFKTKLNVTLQVLVDLKRVLKEDTDLELNLNKTTVLLKGVSQQDTLILMYRTL